jgi:YHS domain-containing protein
MVRDPVCGMEVDPKTTRWSMEYRGAVYYFCSEKCLNDFVADSDKYLSRGSGGQTHDHGGMGGCCGGVGGRMGYIHLALMILFLILIVTRNL